MEDGGVRPASDGYILIRKKDMDNAGVAVDVDDKITTLGHDEYENLFIVKKTPMGHYPDQDGSSLIKFHFEDRSPTVTVKSEHGGATLE